MTDEQVLTPESDDQQRANFWAMIIHLSTLAIFVIPLVGIVTPIVIWQIKKEALPSVDQHGKMVTNWLISSLIYWVGCIALSIIFIGIPLMFVLMVLFVIFAIIGGLKAQEGILWEYPLTIKFFN